jgi:hypothetical protein
MKYRKLRIAWSVAWGIVAVLLLMLWVRSYLYHDRVLIRFGQANRVGGFVSAYGAVAIGGGDTPDLGDNQFRLITKRARQSLIDDLGPPLKLHAFGFDDWYITIPLWLVVIPTIVACFAPWHQFSLRTLLIATTLVAVVLG